VRGARCLSLVSIPLERVRYGRETSRRGRSLRPAVSPWIMRPPERLGVHLSLDFEESVMFAIALSLPSSLSVSR